MKSGQTTTSSKDFEAPLLSTLQQGALALVSLVIVAFGQPAWSWWGGLLAAAFGYALFWRVLLCYPDRWHRFWLSTGWFTLIQLVQLSWSTSHPYLYIYPIYTSISLFIGLQFGFLGLFITTYHLKRFSHTLALAALWTLIEWSRLFFFSGYSWNPVGVALTGGIYPLQMASLWGVYGLSFWVIFTNLLALRAWCSHLAWMASTLWVAVMLIPYVYGAVHLKIHTDAMQQHAQEDFHVVLVQTTFPIEEEMKFPDKNAMIAFIIEEWKEILKTTKKHAGKPVDLVVLPEYAVPGGTYTFLYPYDVVYNAFKEVLGADSVDLLPVPHTPLARSVKTPKGEKFLVNNAFWVQGIANIFHAGVVVGLEDAENVAPDKREYYSAALYFQPCDPKDLSTFFAQRYEKRVLVPLGEYIPFEFCKAIVAQYGVQGSFTPGKEAKVFCTDKLPFGLSICYEETFGDLTRENKQRGAAMLVNITNDGWYPNSRLPMQHFWHSRLRSIESGIPLVRASNFGITGVVDSLGQLVAMLGEDSAQPDQVFDAIHVKVPTYTYQTLYSHVGDGLIIGISILLALLFFRLR